MLNQNESKRTIGFAVIIATEGQSLHVIPRPFEVICKPGERATPLKAREIYLKIEPYIYQSHDIIACEH